MKKGIELDTGMKVVVPKGRWEIIHFDSTGGAYSGEFAEFDFNQEGWLLDYCGHADYVWNVFTYLMDGEGGCHPVIIAIAEGMVKVSK